MTTVKIFGLDIAIGKVNGSVQFLIGVNFISFIVVVINLFEWFQFRVSSAPPNPGTTNNL